MQTDGSQIREHMDVISLDGHIVGKVDRVEGHKIKLIKSSVPPGDKHYYVDLNQVMTEDGALRLSKNKSEPQLSSSPV